MILGFVWKLILNFQINALPQDTTSMQFTEDDGPRNALMMWCRERLGPYKVEINDFSTSFQDGVALLSLFHGQNNKVVNLDSIDPVHLTVRSTDAITE